MNLKEKQLKIESICTRIMDGKYGLLENSKNITFNIQDVNIIKKSLFNKSKISKGFEKELFYKASVNLTLASYENIFKTLDNYLKKPKTRDSKKSVDYDVENNYEERPAKMVTINPEVLHSKLKNDLKDYIYLFDSTLNVVRLYLRNSAEYIINLNEINKIQKSLEVVGLDIKIHYLSESKIIKNMTKLEKKEFINFLDTY